MACDLERGRRLTRRRIATISFGLVCTYAVATVSAVLLHPARAEIAAAVAVISPGFLGVFTAIILGYMGTSAAERVLKKDGPDA